MDPMVFLKGVIVGFAMAVPIGPLGILCIRKTLAEGHSRGLIIGLAAATADSLWGSIVAFGLTFVSDLVASQHFWLRLVGGGILLLLGIRLTIAKRKGRLLPLDNRGFWGSYVSAFLIGLTNPLTIFVFVAVFAAFGLGQNIVVVTAGVLILGVFAGSCLWFFALGHIATSFRTKLDSGGLRWVDRIAGVLIISTGVAAFVSVL